MTLQELSNIVATRLRYNKVATWKVCRELLKVLVETLEAEEDISLVRLGRFRWVFYGRSKYFNVNTRDVQERRGGIRLKFYPAPRLRKRRSIMEKFGVVLDEELEKKASKDDGRKVCPKCGEELSEAGACPVHGTEPMEKRPAKKG